MKRLLVDMDEVLTRYTEKVLDTLKKDTGQVVSLDEYPGQFLSKVLDEKHLNIVSSYPNTPGFFRDMPVMPGAKEALQQLNNHYEIFIVTAATKHPNALKDKLEWLFDQFPFLDHKNVIFTDHKGIIKADFLIDDHPRHLERFDEKALLFSAWHNVYEDRFHRFDNWEYACNWLLT